MPIDLREALEHHRRGQLDWAARAYQAALLEDPDRDEALHLLGLVALQRGDPARAVALIARAIASRPDLADYHAALGEAYWALGQLDRSVECGREAVRLRPDRPDFACNLGATLVRLGKVAEGVEAFRQALRLRPDLVQAHNNLANALQLLGESTAAVVHFREAARLDPGSAQVRANLCKILLDRGELEEALVHGREAVRLAPGSVEALVNLGNVLHLLDRLDEAEACLREAIRLRPDSAPALAGLGAIREQYGDSEESLAMLRMALRHDPRHAGVLARLAIRLRDRLPDAEQAAIEGLLAEPGLPSDQRVPLLFGLAHVFDARGEFERAAGFSIEANAGQRTDLDRRGRGYDPEAHSRFVDELIEAFNPAFFERVEGGGLMTDRPIFVVGMPRSGTSLVEQILASHPRVFGAGELRLMGDVFKAIPGATEGPGRLRDSLDRLDREGVQRLAGRYLDGLTARDASADQVVDKMPENLLYLGLIAALFPHARLILCRRDPRDVALSCWITHFGQLRWSCDPGHIASRIAEADRLMDHWRRALPSPILEVDYESLVDDLEGTSRRLLDWCGLDWDPVCLEFHKTRRAVRTASTAQVRQPIYRTSIGRWKNYERSLASLFEGLGTFRD